MKQTDFEADWLSPPGDTIAEAMTGQNVGKQALAHRLSMPLQDLDDLLQGLAPVTRDIATALAQTLGGSVSFWVKREELYRDAYENRLSTLDAQTCKAWLARVSVNEMASRGNIKLAGNARANAIQCLRFFGVSTIDAWEKKYAPIIESASFRSSASFESDPNAVAVWIREGQLQASKVPTSAWKPEVLRSRIPEMRRLSLLRYPTDYVASLKELCADCGVALAIKRTPSKCYASGAVMTLPRSRVMMLLSFRHLSDDHFWFTFFHEVGHLLLHIQKRQLIVDEESAQVSSTEEDEANSFARNVLVPSEHQNQLRQLQRNRWEIARFARGVGISPGIVVGQLQHLGQLEHYQMNHLKRRYSAGEIEALSL